MEFRIQIHETSRASFLFFFFFFGKTLWKSRVSTERLNRMAEGRNPDSYECLSGYVSGVCIEPMATGIKYQSKNPIKLQEFLANRLLSSPSPSPALSRDRLHSLHSSLKYSRSLARAQSLLPSQVLLLLRVLFFKSNSSAKMNILRTYYTVERDDHRTSNSCWFSHV